MKIKFIVKVNDVVVSTTDNPQMVLQIVQDLTISNIMSKTDYEVCHYGGSDDSEQIVSFTVHNDK